jgi:hypothetical protein
MQRNKFVIRKFVKISLNEPLSLMNHGLRQVRKNQVCKFKFVSGPSPYFTKLKAKNKFVEKRYSPYGRGRHLCSPVSRGRWACISHQFPIQGKTGSDARPARHTRIAALIHHNQQIGVNYDRYRQ